MSVQKVTIYHNPRCSKSCQAMRLLEEQGVEIEVIDYLNQTPSRKDLKHLMKLLGLDDPRDMMRKGEEAYSEQGLDDPELTLDALLNAIVQHPILLQRPIVAANGKAIIARPPENVLTFLGVEPAANAM